MNSAGAILLRDLIRISFRKLGLLQKKEISCCGITLTQCHALIELGQAGEITANECAALLDLDKSTVSRALDNMVKGGLVERTEHPEDRRYVKLSLTPVGRDMFNTINRNMDEYYLRIISAIPAEKQSLVVEALPYLLKAVSDTAMVMENCSCLITEKEV